MRIIRAFAPRIAAAIVLVASPVFTTASAATLTPLASFNTTNGKEPRAGLIADAAGNLYGTTYEGGANNYGTVFKVAAGTNVLSTLVSFTGTNGAWPYAPLTADSGGNLYGTTTLGGAGQGGTVFKLTAGGAFSTLASFNGTNGSESQGALITDAAGNFYGTTWHGGTSNNGTVFKLTPGGTLSTLATFNGGNGALPYDGLTADTNGNFYGTTGYGGSSNVGTVFKLTAGGTLSTLVSFNNNNGADPRAGLTADAAGNFYGTTYEGGYGTVFKITPGGTLTTIAAFDFYTNGAAPYARVLVDAVGNVYGTENYGGTSRQGSVFKIAAGTNTITTLASFDNTSGSNSVAGLIADATGNLYGTTRFGGAGGGGTVFKLTDTGFVVPEPSSLALVGLTAALALRRRRV